MCLALKNAHLVCFRVRQTKTDRERESKEAYTKRNQIRKRGDYKRVRR
jgi:hypothetical protein